MSNDLCRMVSIAEEDDEAPAPVFKSYLAHTLSVPSVPALKHHVQVVRSSSSSVCATASLEHQTCYFRTGKGDHPLIPVNNALTIHHYQQQCINYYTR
jgi:hypothetical protein